MATVHVNGNAVDIGDEKLNLIQAAQRAGVEIPHYCWHPQLSVVASCRMCLVEAGDKKPDGSIVMQPKLIPGCQTPAKDGTVIVCNTPKVKQAQQQTLEFLLLNHPLDCPICDQAGECFLQDYSYKYGRSVSRLNEPKVQRKDKHHIGEQITLFTDRCVMCTRCVRFTREISGTGELQVVNRGDHAEIDIFPGQPCNNKLAGNVVDICPVGALCSKDFLYKQRVWWLRSEKTVCAGCSTGCSIFADQSADRMYRLRPRANPQAQGHFMCDPGRFGFKYIHSESRLKQPTKLENGAQKAVAWEILLANVREKLQEQVTKAGGASLVAVLSPWMTVEEAFLLGSYVKSLSPSARLALGPVRVEGSDDHYPKSPSGEAISPTRFTIRAEKAPNANGVRRVIAGLDANALDFETLLSELDQGRVSAVYFVGGDPQSSITEQQARRLRRANVLVAQDILPTAVTAVADFVVPGASFAERDGTFVNHAGLAQLIRFTVRSPGEARSDGRILWDLAERIGLFHPQTVRQELGAAIGSLAKLSSGIIGEQGVLLG